MAKNKKTVHKSFTYLQCDDFAAYLSQMAAQGWHFKEWKFGLVFEKGEPENVVYAVEVFIHGSNYDMRPEGSTLNFAEYCEAAGWKLMDARGKFCIFKQIRADAVDILTPEERLQNAAKAYMKDLAPQIALTILWTLQLFGDFFPVSDFIVTIFSAEDLIFSGCKLYFLIYIIFKLVWFYIWKQKAKKICISGETKILCNASEAPWNWFACILGAVLSVGLLLCGDGWLIALIIGTLAFTLLLRLLLAKSRPDAATNFSITIAFTMLVFVSVFAVAFASVEYSSKNNVPTELADALYHESTEEIGALTDTYYRNSVSTFGSKQRCHLTYENANLSYNLYKTEQDWLLDVVWDYNLSEQINEEQTDCTALWNAETAFQNQDNVYYIRYDNEVLVLDIGKNMTLSAEQVTAVRSILGLE